ncbi:flagellar motor protein MotB [Asticcacaulis sp. EMRT-3]|uniref:flagellar motor protein MotB n=1 Tax=Asticcacaulis sp. EMRT-3 TaxID=3040349 RepID=UPI0024AFB2F8|nr:flagellar motor protein MotB [Asticcacaulis sp. EMRT-3]MDI7774384.1 flagellar motor protein MotB [Asticcacaulis sp. EMRT-3]
MASRDAPILIKKVKKVSGGGHHGGAWKVAYADFVTAMMAFFLLMWLINTTSPEQKRGVADYFAPANVSQSTSGSGGILGGQALGTDGDKNEGTMSFIEQMAPKPPNTQDPDGQSSQTKGKGSAGSNADNDQETDAQKQEQMAFQSAAESLRQALQDMPELAELSKNILVDQTPEGLRIQLIDQEGRSMFNVNSAQPNDRAKLLLRAVAKIINRLPNRITITGHTSAVAGQSDQDPKDWALSAARADASRAVLQAAGVDQDRIAEVSGKAAKEPLYPDDPSLAGNRRISIVLLREAPVLPQN